MSIDKYNKRKSQNLFNSKDRPEGAVETEIETQWTYSMIYIPYNDVYLNSNHLIAYLYTYN